MPRSFKLYKTGGVASGPALANSAATLPMTLQFVIALHDPGGKRGRSRHQVRNSKPILN